MSQAKLVSLTGAGVVGLIAVWYLLRWLLPVLFVGGGAFLLYKYLAYRNQQDPQDEDEL